MRRLLVVAAAFAAVLALAACGGGKSGASGSHDDPFSKAYAPLNTQVLNAGKAMAAVLGVTGEGADPALAKQFGLLAGQLGTIDVKLRKLKPPADLKPDLDDLTAGLADVRLTVERIGKAERKGNAAAVKAAAAPLAEQAKVVDDAQNKLAEATGTDKGKS
jgi:hypothetical protein